MRDMSMEKILATKLPRFNNMTVRKFFETCLVRMWEDGESFGGKYTIGDSDWQHVIIYALAGVNRSEEDVSDEDFDQYHKMVLAALRYMCK